MNVMIGRLHICMIIDFFIISLERISTFMQLGCAVRIHQSLLDRGSTKIQSAYFVLLSVKIISNY